MRLSPRGISACRDRWTPRDREIDHCDGAGKSDGDALCTLDRIEQAIVAWSPLSHPLGPVGYAVAYELVLEQLQLGLDVIVECVNPVAVTRDGWVGTAATADAALIEVEVICSDEAEHRHRVETRTSDVDGLSKPTWSAVVRREYEPWTREHLVIDTTTTSPDEAADRIATEMASARAGSGLHR